MQSKYDGKCKDCGATHTIGQNIGKNKNGNWCSHGESCTGAVQTTQTSTPESTSPTTKKDAIIKFKQMLADVNCNPSDDALVHAYAILWSRS